MEEVRAASIGPGTTYLPFSSLNCSLIRPVILRYVPSSIFPRSPVRKNLAYDLTSEPTVRERYGKEKLYPRLTSRLLCYNIHEHPEVSSREVFGKPDEWAPQNKFSSRPRLRKVSEERWACMGVSICRPPFFWKISLVQSRCYGIRCGVFARMEVLSAIIGQ